jgi:predicted MFS family arabinose efflux permease
MLGTFFRKYREAYAGLPRDAWALSFILFINTSGTMVIFFLTLYLTRHLGFTVARAGQALSAYGLGMLVGNLLGGFSSDRLGPRATQRLSLALSGITLIVLGFCRDFPAIVLFLFLYGVFAAVLFPANASALAEICSPEIRSRGFVLSRLANNLGATIGPVVGGFLAGRNYGLLFWVDGATCLAAALAFFVLFPTRLSRTTRSSKMTWSSQTSQTAERRSRTALVPVSRPKPFAWRKDETLISVLVLTIGISAIFIQFFGTYPLYMKTVYGFSENLIGPLFAVNTVLIVLFQMILTHSVERFRRPRVAAAGVLLLGLGLGIMPFGRGLFYAALTIAVSTFGEMLIMPTLVTMISLRAPEGGQGRYQGLFGLAFALGAIVGPAAGTRIYEKSGGMVLWLCAAGLAAALALGFMILDRSRRTARAG